MKTMCAITAVLSALTILLLVPLEAEAQGGGPLVPLEVEAHGGGHGGDMRSFHFRGHHQAFGFRHHRGFGFGLGPYGYYDMPPYTSDDSSTDSTPQIGSEPEPPRAQCQHSEQTYTVPSENGGTRQITIQRC